MARGCGCAGSSCGCVIIAGAGITVEGNGTAASPFKVSNAGVTQIRTSLAGSPSSADRIQITVRGAGTPADPAVISATHTLRMVDLADVKPSKALAAGYVPVWTVDSPTTGHWDVGAPPTAAPGAVTTGLGLVGDGSGTAPLQAATAGAWGDGTLAGFGTQSTQGAPVYADSNGQLRTTPLGQLPGYTAAALPTAKNGRMVYVTDTGAILVGSGGAWVALNQGASPIGAITAFGGVTPPAGWLVCNGTARERTDFPALFATLGTAYGAPTSTSFSLPDLQGRVPVGWVSGDPELSLMGAKGGSRTHRLTEQEMPSHTHELANGATDIISNAAGGTLYATQGGTTFAYRGSQLIAKGGGLPHQNMQPYQVVRYIIRAL
jgi:microcystin-dependent protein